MKNKLVLAIVFLLMVLYAFFPDGSRTETIRWIIPEGEKLEMVRNAEVEFLVNGVVQKVYHERNIINLSCFKKENTQSKVKGEFTIYQKHDDEDVYNLKEQYPSEFIIRSDGVFSVDDKWKMPNVRNIPAFPEGEVKQGDSWNASSEIMFINFEKPLKVAFDTKYTLLGVKNLEGREIALIDYSYSFQKKTSQSNCGKDCPDMIIGKNRGRLYWDIKGSKPDSGKDHYRVAFLYRSDDGGISTIEFNMNIETTNKMFVKVKKEEREAEQKEIQKNIPENSGITVENEKRGLVVRLGEVFFDFDSHNLKESSKTSLEKVSEILKTRYKDREIVVEGFTDSIGENEYNKKLSERRARSVASFMKGKISNDKLSYRGLGEEKPIADNSTEDGRQKNRRVDIIIRME